MFSHHHPPGMLRFHEPIASNTSSPKRVLDQIRPELSLEVKTLKLKLPCFGHIERRQDSLEKDHHARKSRRKQKKRKTPM